MFIVTSCVVLLTSWSFHRRVIEFAVVERILEKHSSAALMVCEKQLNIYGLRPRPDALPVLSHEIDDRRLLFNNLPDSVSTESLKTYLQRASQCQDLGSEIGTQFEVTSVIYAMHRGTAMAVFRHPYGKCIRALLPKQLFKKCMLYVFIYLLIHRKIVNFFLFLL